MFSGRKLRVDLAESSGGDRERGDNAGRSGQFAVVVTGFFSCQFVAYLTYSRPDITSVVDWASKANYLSVYLTYKRAGGYS